MKRKTFRMSGGKDRKAKKENFTFTMSPEEEALPITDTEDTQSVETPRQTLETFLPDETLPAEPTPVQNDGSIFSEEEVVVEKKEEQVPDMQIENTHTPEETLTETPLKSKEPFKAEIEKTECVPDSPLPTFYNGPNLAEIRKRCGITLKAIWEETKIPIKTLENIETEKYEELPPEVYTKSFIRTYAKLLSLDPEKAVKDYMERYRVWKADSVKKERRKSSGSIFGIKMKSSK